MTLPNRLPDHGLIEEFRPRLLELRRTQQARLEQSTTAEDDVTVALGRRAERLIEDIDAALAAIEEGRYGMCASCGRPIAWERLDAIPHAASCSGCAAMR